ncbi:hypothetical protein DRQ15_06655 [candidate division KSB1 bacterium]|nr:MAG: hypothetical protein DRQ15_06655 [candidate division KSB1 bacterium]
MHLIKIAFTRPRGKMMNPILLSLPIISALIGWLTNWVAIRMLFRPARPVRILGIRIQGLIPARQKEMAQKFGEVIEKNFFSHEDLSNILENLDLRGQFTRKIDSIINRKIQTSSTLLSVIRKIPVIRAPFELFIKGIKQTIRDSVIKDIELTSGEIISQIKGNIKIKEIVKQRIESFEVDYLEEVVLRLSKRELKAIEYLGGVLGFIIGWVQLGLISII